MYTKHALSGPYAKYFKATYNLTKEDFDQMSIWEIIKFSDKAYSEIFDKAEDPTKFFTPHQW